MSDPDDNRNIRPHTVHVRRSIAGSSCAPQDGTTNNDLHTGCVPGTKGDLDHAGWHRKENKDPWVLDELGRPALPGELCPGWLLREHDPRADPGLPPANRL